MSDADGTSRQSFWTTFPGVATAVATLISAITGLIVGLVQAGIFDTDGDRPDPTAVVAAEPSSSLHTPAGPPPPTATPVPTPGPKWTDISGDWNLQRSFPSGIDPALYPADFKFEVTRGEVDVYQYGQVDASGQRIPQEATVEGNIAHVPVPDPAILAAGTRVDLEITDGEMIGTLYDPNYGPVITYRFTRR